MPEIKTGGPDRPPSTNGTANGRPDIQQNVSTIAALVQFARRGIFEAALIWLARGFALVPLQPGGKHIIHGFGSVQRTITGEQEARIWFNRNGCNLGVVIAPGFYCADFDDREAMRAWRAGRGADVGGFVEKTARGFHVFLAGDCPRGLAGPGLELKAPGLVVMSAPSVGSNGAIYSWFSGHWPPDVVDWRDSFSPFLSERPARPSREVTAGARPPAGGNNLVGKIKRAFLVLDELEAAGVKQWLSGGKETYVALCPFHSDHSPSLWARPGLGVWGCNSPTCQAHGTQDVVNARAMARRISVGEAIRQMARDLPKGQ